MTISITDRDDVLTDDLRQLAERRLLFALSRFSDRIRKVDLIVGDENGPRGGIDKACRIHVQMFRANDVIVRDRDSDMAACLSRAAERVGRTVARVVDKKQSINRVRSKFRDSAIQASADLLEGQTAAAS